MFQAVASLVAEFFPTLIEAVQPRRRPAAQPFEKRRAQRRKSLKDSAREHGAESEHRFDCMSGGVGQREVVIVANADMTVVGKVNSVKGNGNIEIDSSGPEWIIIGIIKRPAHNLMIGQD